MQQELIVFRIITFLCLNKELLRTTCWSIVTLATIPIKLVLLGLLDLLLFDKVGFVGKYSIIAWGIANVYKIFFALSNAIIPIEPLCNRLRLTSTRFFQKAWQVTFPEFSTGLFWVTVRDLLAKLIRVLTSYKRMHLFLHRIILGEIHWRGIFGNTHWIG